MLKRFSKHAYQAIQYIGLATAVGGSIIGVIALAGYTVSAFYGYFGFFGTAALALIIGIGNISAYKAYQENQRRANVIEDFAGQMVHSSRNFAPTNAQFEAWAKTPAGRDALYQLLKRGGRPNLASAARLKATPVQSENGYFTEEQKAEIEAANQRQELKNWPDTLSESEEVRHIRAK